MQNITTFLPESSEADTCAQYAVDLFTDRPGNLFCSEVVPVALARVEGITSELIPRIASGFYGGMGLMDEMCGAVCGGIMGISLMHGRDSGNDSPVPVTIRVQAFLKIIQSQFGSTNCKELTSYSLGNPEELVRFQEDEEKRAQCALLVKHCTALAYKLNHATDEDVSKLLSGSET